MAVSLTTLASRGRNIFENMGLRTPEFIRDPVFIWDPAFNGSFTVQQQTFTSTLRCLS